MASARQLIESDFVDYGEPGDAQAEWGLEFHAQFEDDFNPGDLHDDDYHNWQHAEYQARQAAVDKLIPFLQRRGVDIEHLPTRFPGPRSIDDYSFFGDANEARRVQGLISAAGIENCKVTLNTSDSGRNHNLYQAAHAALQDLRSQGIKYLQLVDCDNKSFGSEPWMKRTKRKFYGSRYEFKLPKKEQSSRRSTAMEVAASIITSEAGELACERGELDPFDDTDDIKYLCPAYVVKDASAAAYRRRGRKEATITKEFDNIPDAIALVKELVLKAAK